MSSALLSQRPSLTEEPSEVAIPMDNFLSANSDAVEPVQIVFKNLRYAVTMKGKGPGAEDRRPIVSSTATSSEKLEAGAAAETAPAPTGRFGRHRTRTPRTYEKTILHSLVGAFQPGRVTAILGPSGSGKTSLLNIMAGSVKAGHITGDILVNGRQVTGQAIRLVSGYVFQDDVILPTMTVEEAIDMCAMLRCPELGPTERRRRVDEVIALLELDKARHTIIGSPDKKGVSGGERKRCAIAMELITNPSVLFLDEPTSGLDAYTAATVTYILKQLAQSGRTVVAVMHQPSSEIFHTFDDVMILHEGRTVYLGEAAHAVNYFSRVGYRCPTYTNPADYFFMSILYQFDPSNLQVGDKTGQIQAEHRRMDEIYQFWQDSPEAAYYRHLSDNPLTRRITTSTFKRRATLGVQYKTLLRRSAHNALRNKMVIHAKLGQAIFFGVFVGLIFLRIPHKDSLAAQAQDMTGALFFVAVNQFFANSMPVVTTYAAERDVFTREHGNGLYSLPAYFLAKNTVELPFVILAPFIFSCITYWMFGLQASAAKFFIYVAVTITVALCGNAFGTFMACSIKDLAIAMVIMPVIILPLMIFGGLFVNTGSAPPYLAWIQWISPIKYGFSALAINQLRGYTSQGQNIGDTTLENLDLGSFGILVNIIFLLGLFLVLFVLAYLGLWRLVRVNAAGKIQRGKLSPKKQLLADPLAHFPALEDISGPYRESPSDVALSEKHLNGEPRQRLVSKHTLDDIASADGPAHFGSVGTFVHPTAGSLVPGADETVHSTAESRRSSANGSSAP
ncbi:hypothetical protein IWQ60_002704 [Tieghemiomyces parasiticus]|uniref:ABC transporter domain-containing protein n=1 Tax=Tieghemiomyces parasiticus TaxID=78921 RepID=A0A9W8E1D6_9FUNG|nr:hypothetical protein IWQ60_002704 [Tieghemiomyces parasiticus]